MERDGKKEKEEKRKEWEGRREDKRGGEEGEQGFQQAVLTELTLSYLGLKRPRSADSSISRLLYSLLLICFGNLLVESLFSK